MKLPNDAQVIIGRYVAKFPVPTTSEVAAQDWTHNLCRQLVYSFPGDGWCHKSAGPGRPHSKDCVAIQRSGQFYGWDIVLSAGSSAATLDLNADSQDLTGQQPEPVVPYNYLDDDPPDPPPPIGPRGPGHQAGAGGARGRGGPRGRLGTLKGDSDATPRLRVRRDGRCWRSPAPRWRRSIRNPSVATFTASVDHAQVSSYTIGYFLPGATDPVQTTDLGKPTPDATQTCTVTLNVMPLTFGANYTAKVKAVAGTVSSDWSTASNPFDRVPGPPSKTCREVGPAWRWLWRWLGKCVT